MFIWRAKGINVNAPNLGIPYTSRRTMNSSNILPSHLVLQAWSCHPIYNKPLRPQIFLVLIVKGRRHGYILLMMFCAGRIRKLVKVFSSTKQPAQRGCHPKLYHVGVLRMVYLHLRHAEDDKRERAGRHPVPLTFA